MKFSVLISVYKNEKVEYFIQAMDSLFNQTVIPDQIVLVRDGQVYRELQIALDKYVVNYTSIVTYVPLEQNGGLGNALRVGLTYCRNEYVARMDTDDISVGNRFEKQIEFLTANPNVDIVGGNISEFIDSEDNIVDYRIVPQKHDDIATYLKSRSPFNHVTVMFKKSIVEQAGSYESFYLFEDWYLWVRMYLTGARFANINDVLVNVRVFDMANRRGGIKYYKSCINLLKYMRKNRVITGFNYFKISVIRFCGYVLLPNKLRAWAYKKFLRKNKN